MSKPLDLMGLGLADWTRRPGCRLVVGLDFGQPGMTVVLVPTADPISDGRMAVLREWLRPRMYLQFDSEGAPDVDWPPQRTTP